MNNLNEIKLEITKDLNDLSNIFMKNLKSITNNMKNLKCLVISDLVDINTPKGYLVYITQAEKFKNVQNLLSFKEKQELKDFIQDNIDKMYVDIIDVLKSNNLYNKMPNDRVLQTPVNAFEPYAKNYHKPINMFENINNIDVGEHKSLVTPFMIYGSSECSPNIEKEVVLCLVDLLKNVKEEEGPMQWLLVNYYATNMISYVVKNYADVIKSSKDKRTFEEKETEIDALVQKTIKLQNLNNRVKIVDNILMHRYDMYQNNQSLCYNFDIDNQVLLSLGNEEINNIKKFLQKSIILERKFPNISAKALTSLVKEWKNFADGNMGNRIDQKTQEKMKKFFFKERMPLKTFQEHAIKSQEDLLFQFEEYLASEIPKYTKVIKKESKNITFDFEEVELSPHEQESLFITLTITNDEIHKQNLTRESLIQTIEWQRETSDIDYFIRMKKPNGCLILEIKVPYSFDYTINVEDFSNFMIEKLITNIHNLKNNQDISLLMQTNEVIAQIRESKLFAILEEKKDVKTNVKRKI